MAASGDVHSSTATATAATAAPAPAPAATPRWRAAYAWRLAFLGAVLFGLLSRDTSLLYFTVQSNVVAGLYIGCAVHRMATTRDLVPPSVRTKGAVTLYLVITGLVSHFVLEHGANPIPAILDGPDQWQRLSTFFLHYVTPVMIVGDWLLFDRKGVWRARDAMVWLAFPLAYAAVSLLRAGLLPHVEPRYVYSFLDADALGVGGVAVQIAFMTVFFALLALGLVGLDRLLARRTGSAAPAPAAPATADRG